MVTLNAESPSTWRYLAHWRDHLSLDREEDRTKLYHERVARQEFLTAQAGKKRFKRVVWEAPPTWDAEDVRAIAADTGVIASLDPLAHGTTTESFGYYRLPGPAGHKSRYEDPAIDKLAGVALGCKNENAIFVFTNVDMFADAKRLKKAMKLQ